MDFLEYNDVSVETRGNMMSGKLKLTDEKIIFRGTRSGKKEHEIAASDVDLVNWQRLAGSWGLRLFTKDGNLTRVAGFKEQERDRLEKFFSQTFKMDMKDRDLSVKGWNWGTANFTGGVLGFEVGGKSDAFEIPLSYVNQCLPGKNEVTLEFHSNDDAAVMLTEMRFHIPAIELESGEDPVESFKEQVMKKASIVTTSGDAIAIFREIHCLSPRGRYDIKIFPTFFHLHGKTFDYKISASSVMRLFLLPHKDQRQTHFAVNVDPPIKQGQTRYHYLIFSFKQEDEEEISLPFTDEELQEKFDGKLEKEITGPTYEVISKILKALTGKKLTLPGSFLGHSGTPAISCSHKAASGFLYPLERGFIFIYKPPIYLRYDEVRSVSFERSGGSTRSFDVMVTTNNDLSYTFSSIEKGEYSRLYDYLKSKKINVKSSGKVGKSGLNFDEDVDHHLEKVKADAQEFSSGDDSMSSDDSDFNPDKLEALSAKEEYDSEPSSTSSDEDSTGDEAGPEAEQRRAERKKKKEEKREKKEKTKSSSSAPRERKERKQKKTKLPGQPKRNMSAYFIWMNSNREFIKAKFPNMSVAEFGKKAGEMWKEMTDKSEWEKKAAEDKKRYDEEFAKWKSEGGAEAMAEAKKAAKKEKRLAKAAASGGAAAKPKAAKKVAAAASTDSPSKAAVSGGSGAGFKSKEFIESDSSSGGGGGGSGSGGGSGDDSD